ncbi:MAG: DUF3857 domain-containing protein [Bacteriovoracia bacterium]
MKFYLLLSLLLVPPALARWADRKEAGYAIVMETAAYKIKKGGRYSVETAREVEILKDNERLNMGLTRMNFDAHASDYELLEAFTQNGEKKIPVRAQHIEIKPLASSGAGFDEQRQVTIAFPDVNVGSHVHYRYRRVIKSPPIQDLFAVQYAVGWGELQRGMILTYESEVPLYYELNDPEQVLEATSGKEGDLFTLKIELKKPVYKTVTEEDDVNMNAASLPWIAVSTAKDWNSFPVLTPSAYEAILDKGELPGRFLAIYEKAKLEKKDVDQINSVTSQLAHAVRYVGDWVPVEGLCHPRPLQVVADTGFGDCKDFSTVTATILRKLGFDTHVAWTNRARNWSDAPIRLPTGTYNHAIVYAKKNGREYWVDPTNTTSFAQGVYEDIAGRNALVLDPTNLSPRKISPATANGSLIDIEMNLHFFPKSILKADGNFTLGGRAIIGMTGTSLMWEKSHIDYELVSWLTDPGNLLGWKFPPFDFSSRIVKDFSTKFEFSKRWNPVQTSAGAGFFVPAPPYLGQLQFRRAERISGLYLQDPKTWRRKIRFLGKKALLKNQPSCKIKSAWLDFTRSFRLRGDALELSEELQFKKSPIPLSDIQSPAFATLQEKVADCLQPAIVVFQ